MENILTKAIFSAQQSEIAFSKYITANDTGSTGGHQAGFHIHKHSWELFFNKPGEKGKNKDKFVTLHLYTTDAADEKRRLHTDVPRKNKTNKKLEIGINQRIMKTKK